MKIDKNHILNDYNTIDYNNLKNEDTYRNQ